MQAWFCETLTGPEGLVWKEVPTPQPGPAKYASPFVLPA